MNSISWPDPSDPGRVSLAYRDLSELPEGWNKQLSFGHITVLDLSHNNLSYPCKDHSRQCRHVVQFLIVEILKTKSFSVKSKISAQPHSFITHTCFDSIHLTDTK